MQELVKKLKEFKLAGMTNSLETRISYANSNKISYEEFLLLLCEDEINNSCDSTLLKVADLEFNNMLSAEEDNLSAVITINPGAGGTESQDWAEMLMRM